CMQCLEFPFTF
nr:immunoglobulin light chain junction region [Macaca mulatta]MOW08638.1 immunoglobulin light chain junction region [Macaca mulatta]MOW08715.1 immunoglobulin light chain junction region [Macaca mulatta]MOW08878.1 immunoglobulin light chain junction region [Macaca mulatta]MOW09588.1 immunoglobulin light chain junction region [Macaca mulatta]